MDLQLQGKHALITGGSKGIGFSYAKGFLAEGASVSLVSRDSGHLEEARKKLLDEFPSAVQKIGIYPADLKDAAIAADCLDRVERGRGAVDILVNSAGAARRTPPDELTPRHWHEAMDAKFFTYIHIMDPTVKRMAQRGGGVVVNVIGLGGKMATIIHLPGGAANSALMLVSAGLAAAYGPKGVRVNAINPGLTLTERLQEGLKADARLQGITPEEALRRATERMPLGRIATPEEIANAVLFLSSPQASHISGAVLAMDGAFAPMIL